jgi:hypothetical protein
MSGNVAVTDRIPENDLLKHLFATYGVAEDSNQERSRFIDQHLLSLEQADNEVVSRAGFVLRKAQEGFGLGYKVPVVVIAMGKAMLGIDLAVMTPLVATHPAAWTCAALGAVYYGYTALGDEERIALTAKVGAALDFGAELVRGIVQFCIDTLKSVLSDENIKKMKAMVAETAAAFGLTIADITRSLLDRVYTFASSSVETASSVAATAASSIGDLAGTAYATGNRLLQRGDPTDK